MKNTFCPTVQVAIPSASSHIQGSLLTGNSFKCGIPLKTKHVSSPKVEISKNLSFVKMKFSLDEHLGVVPCVPS